MLMRFMTIFRFSINRLFKSEKGAAISIFLDERRRESSSELAIRVAWSASRLESHSKAKEQLISQSWFIVYVKFIRGMNLHNKPSKGQIKTSTKNFPIFVCWTVCSHKKINFYREVFHKVFRRSFFASPIRNFVSFICNLFAPPSDPIRLM